jgi:negative regulator of flagellin synthesis FlgM
MKITNTNNYINQTYTSQTNAQGPLQQENKTPEESGAAKDSINLSSTTRDLQKIEAAAQTPSPERAQRVQGLKEQVQNNTYTVNAEAVAEKMIGFNTDEVG